MSQDAPKVVAVLGPTASGKSALAVELALKFRGEIVSADSRQVYRGLDIGTGKVTRSEMKGIPHHLLGVASPRSNFSVAKFQRLSRRAVKDILRRGRLPVVCGGTGLYADALLYDVAFPAVKPDPCLRRELEKKTAEELFTELAAADPARAAIIDRRNKRRLVRALEIIRTTGKPIPPASRESPYRVLKIGVRVPEKSLRDKIGRRLRLRLGKGMVREVGRLRETGIPWRRLDEMGLEYRYASRYLRGQIAKREMVSMLEKEIWQYAKRQMTWFKRDKDIRWIETREEAERLVAEFLRT